MYSARHVILWGIHSQYQINYAKPAQLCSQCLRFSRFYLSLRHVCMHLEQAAMQAKQNDILAIKNSCYLVPDAINHKKTCHAIAFFEDCSFKMSACFLNILMIALAGNPAFGRVTRPHVEKGASTSKGKKLCQHQLPKFLSINLIIAIAPSRVRNRI